MSTNILSNYLIFTLVPALHEKRIHIGDDTYRVHVTDCSRAGEFVHIDRMCEKDDWSIVATPGWDGATTTIPIDVHHEAGEVVLADNATDVAWTGKLEYDVQVYLHTVRNHIIKVILPALWPDSTDDMKTQLRAIEGNLRSASIDLWALTVDDPETATIESEEAGMTPEREAIRDLRLRLDQLLIGLEDLTNSTMTDSTEEPKTKTIVMFSDGETWGICAHALDITDEEYERISEGGEKVHSVVPDWAARSTVI